jgi:hypothetical protein
MQIRRLTRLTNAFSKEVAKSESSVGSVLRLLQLLPCASDVAGYPGGNFPRCLENLRNLIVPFFNCNTHLGTLPQPGTPPKQLYQGGSLSKPPSELPIPPGYVRLYRGEPKPTGKQLPDWIEQGRRRRDLVPRLQVEGGL